MRSNPVKAALREGKPQIGTWLSLASPLAARYMAQMGSPTFDWLTVDIEHSPVNWESAALMFGTIAQSGGVPLARVPLNSLENVKRVLDAGAFGVVFPMCNTVEEAVQAVSVCNYPPKGERSVGGGLHALNFQTNAADYYARANDEILVVVQAEHIRAVEDCDRIFAVPGIDAMFVGPNDLLSSMHKTPNMDSDDPAFIEALTHLRTTAQKHGIAPGIHVSNAAAAQKRIAEGWQFVAISSDLGFMLNGAKSVVQQLRGTSGETSAQVRY